MGQSSSRERRRLPPPADPLPPPPPPPALPPHSARRRQTSASAASRLAGWPTRRRPSRPLSSVSFSHMDRFVDRDGDIVMPDADADADAAAAAAVARRGSLPFPPFGRRGSRRYGSSGLAYDLDDDDDDDDDDDRFDREAESSFAAALARRRSRLNRSSARARLSNVTSSLGSSRYSVPGLFRRATRRDSNRYDDDFAVEAADRPPSRLLRLPGPGSRLSAAPASTAASPPTTTHGFVNGTDNTINNDRGIGTRDDDDNNNNYHHHHYHLPNIPVPDFSFDDHARPWSAPDNDADSLDYLGRPRSSDLASSGSLARPSLRREPRSNNLAERLSSSGRGLRNMTSSLRRRRNGSPSRGRNTTADDQTAVLSRLLSVAAAATALSLIGDNERIHGNDGDESSFNGFLRSLESGRLASTLRQGQGGNDDEDEGSDGQEGVNAPLNFFRMFRFGSSSARQGTSGGESQTGTDNQQQSNHSNNSNNNSTSPNTTDAGGANNDVRMIPIIIVGIRSITPSAGGNPPDGDTAIPPFLDPLANFPSPITGQGDGSGAPGLDGFGGIPQPRNGTRFSHMRRRRASMGGLNAGLSGYDSQRHQRSSEGNGRPWSTISDGGAASSRPPSEPFPSLASSRAPTPLAQNRPSSTTTTTTTAPTTPTTITPTLSASQPSRSSEHSVAAPSPTAITGGSGLAPTVEEDWNPQPASLSPSLRSTRRPFQAPHRRLSDPASRFRIPRFGSGSSRRNAIIEPDPPRGVGAGIGPTNMMADFATGHGEAAAPGTGAVDAGVGAGAGAGTAATTGAARSWIIYVLGGSYPENHPILTTPSLFSDSPTYEDMVLLGSLLGPAKAPVARREDVDAAGGLVTIMRDTDGGGLVGLRVEREDMDGDGDGEMAEVEVDGEVEGRTIVLRLSAEQQCLVCLEEFVAGELGRKLNRCGHLFHRDCIDHWLTTGRNSCPLCRGQGVDEVPPPPYPVDGTQSGFGSASGVPRGGRGEAEAEAEGEI